MCPIECTIRSTGNGDNAFTHATSAMLPDADHPVQKHVGDVVLQWHASAMATEGSGSGRFDIKKESVGPSLYTQELPQIKKEHTLTSSKNSGTFIYNGRTYDFTRIP